MLVPCNAQVASACFPLTGQHNTKSSPQSPVRSLENRKQSRGCALVYTRPVVKVLPRAVSSTVSLDTLSTPLVGKQLLHALWLAGVLDGGLGVLCVI